MDKIFDLTVSMMNPTDPSKPKMKQKEVFDQVIAMGLAPDDWSFSGYQKWFQRQKKKRIPRK